MRFLSKAQDGSQTSGRNINPADKEIIMSRLELRHYAVLPHAATFTLAGEVLLLLR